MKQGYKHTGEFVVIKPPPMRRIMMDSFDATPAGHRSQETL